MTIQKKIKTGFLVGAATVALLWGGACSPSKNKRVQRSFPANPVAVAQALQKDMPFQVNSVGRVEAFSTVAVKAQVGGQITGVYFKEGQSVKKGELLLTIDRRPYEIALKQSESLLEKDRALLRNAEADVERYAGLVQKDYVTKEQYDSLIANRDVLIAAIKADEANVANSKLQLEYCAIVSPIDGRTGSLLIYPGNIIRANDTSPAVVIFQINPIYVSFSVPEQYLPRIQDFMAKETMKTEAFPAGENGPSLPGVLSFVDNTIDPATGTIILKSTFPNGDRALWPGQFLNVSLTLTVEKNVTVVPSQSVQTSQTGQYVFVVKEDMTAEMRPVKVDRTVGGETVIAAGVKPGEKVVTDGQLRLVPGSRVEVKPSR
jgi:multidrug efflux system membrane fusion protein